MAVAVPWEEVTPGVQVVVCGIDDHGLATRYVRVDGHAAPGRAMDHRTVFNVWCAVKPIVARAVLAELDRCDLATDRPITSHLPERLARLGRLRGVTVADLLEHRAVLPEIGLIEAELWGADRLSRTLDRFESWDRTRPDGRAAPDYSEYAAWFLLEQALAVLGPTFDRSRLASSGVRIDVSADHAGPLAMGCYYTMLDGAWLPLPHDLLDAFTERRPASMGGHASASGLAEWYAGRLIDPGLRGLLDRMQATAARWSPLLRSEVTFVDGFMANIGEFLHVPSLSPRAFGHVGWSGASVGLVDPDRGIGLGLVMNTLDVGHDRFFGARDSIIAEALEASA